VRSVRNLKAGVIIAVGADGAVEKLAVQGADAAMVGCCIRPWAATLRFDRSKVPVGTYGFTLHTGPGGSGKAALPTTSELAVLKRPERGCVSGGLNLMLVITPRGYLLRSALGRECPGKSSEHGLCAEWKGLADFQGPAGQKAVEGLARHLHNLYTRKYADPRFWNYNPALRDGITIVPDPLTPFQVLVRFMEAVRDAPGVSSSGCRMTMDPKTGRWFVGQKGRPACMYPHMVLAIGAS